MKEKCFEFLRVKLKEFRKSQNLRQEDIAQILGITRVGYANIEGGKQHITADKIYVLCCVFNVEPNNFYPPIERVEPKVKKVKVVKVKYKTVYKPLL
jgi:transcriptional regulator with XRE-family HTH domain